MIFSHLPGVRSPGQAHRPWIRSTEEHTVPWLIPVPVANKNFLVAGPQRRGASLLPNFQADRRVSLFQALRTGLPFTQGGNLAYLTLGEGGLTPTSLFTDSPDWIRPEGTQEGGSTLLREVGAEVSPGKIHYPLGDIGVTQKPILNTPTKQGLKALIRANWFSQFPLSGDTQTSSPTPREQKFIYGGPGWTTPIFPKVGVIGELSPMGQYSF